MNVLLLEPAYKNKYPPMSLMKISTYHKSLGDTVVFSKGLPKVKAQWDRIYITTLFTFHYKDVVKAIEQCKSLVESPDQIFVGGIMASLLTDDLREDTGLNNIIQGRLFNSALLGFNDNVNIDELPLDYDLLLDCDYEYPAGDNFFAYTTRGCVNKCLFCAVPELEGNLLLTNNVCKQIQTARDLYGDKRNVLLMDNNILALPPIDLKNIVDDLNSLGFIHSPNFYTKSNFDKLADTYCRSLQQGKDLSVVSEKLLDTFDKLVNKKISKKNVDRVNELLSGIGSLYIDKLDMIISNINFFIELDEYYLYKKPMQRYVDFNQGMDARLLTEEKMQILSNIPVRPFRIAYDDIKFTNVYLNAIRLAARYGVKEFSNYLLYNCDDEPISLYKRLKLNVELANELDVHIYSFPMKFEPIYNKYRHHIGKHWNDYYLKSVKAVLNVSKGVFGGDKSFFERAFGKHEQEFFEILSMPKELITYRNHYESLGITDNWRNEFRALSTRERHYLTNALSKDVFTSKNTKINSILRYYKNETLNKKKGIINV